MKFISLGSSCSIAENLRQLNLRDQALPFDWIKVNNFKNINLMIQDNFNKLWNSNYFNLVKTSSKFFYLQGNLKKVYIDMDIYQNTKYNATFYHDFPSNSNNLYENFIEKYQKRVSRFLNILQESNSIIFIREQINPKQICIDDLLEFYQLIHKINPNLEFKLVIILNNFLKKDIDKLINFCDSQKWIDFFVEETRIKSWQRSDIIKPILNQICHDQNQNQNQNLQSQIDL